MEINKEISKEQIAGLLRVLNRCNNLAERLKRNLQKKSKLDVLEKSWLAEHIYLIADISKMNLILAGLNDVSVIQLEAERAESLPPPSAPASVAESETVCCDHCLGETANPVKVGDETLCVVCNNEREAALAKKKIEQERLLEATDRLQDEKDKLSTEVSQQKIALRTKTLQIISNLESIGYENLDARRKKRLTMARKRIADEDAASSVE